MKKVSIIVPCYNSESYIERFINSILNQTYKNLELILVNDGSKDKTEEIILDYEEEFKKKKIELKYYKKENGGAASAINLGLKIFTGDYLIWPDSDDLLHPESIQKRVDFLEKNLEYDLVRTNIKIVDEKNIEEKVGNIYNKSHHDKDIFLHLILEKIPACSGAFMLKRENVLRNISNLNIYESKGGQNWQIELPNTYNQKCGFINEELYTYVVRNDSHSHQNAEDLYHMIERWKEHKKILDITISNMNITEAEKAKYLNIVENKYIKKEMIAYVKLYDKSKSKERYQELKNTEQKIGIKLLTAHYLNQLGLLKLLINTKLLLDNKK